MAQAPQRDGKRLALRLAVSGVLVFAWFFAWWLALRLLIAAHAVRKDDGIWFGLAAFLGPLVLWVYFDRLHPWLFRRVLLPALARGRGWRYEVERRGWLRAPYRRICQVSGTYKGHAFTAMHRSVGGMIPGSSPDSDAVDESTVEVSGLDGYLPALDVEYHRFWGCLEVRGDATARKVLPDSAFERWWTRKLLRGFGFETGSSFVRATFRRPLTAGRLRRAITLMIQIAERFPVEAKVNWSGAARPGPR